MIALLLLQWLSTTLADRNPDILMSGTWTSCPGADGEYEETGRIFSLNSKPLFAMHFGPRDEVALFRGGIPDAHVDHTDASNLLGPAFHYGDLPSRTGRNWSIASLGLGISMVQIPGSVAECYSFAIRITKDPSPKLAHQ